MFGLTTVRIIGPSMEPALRNGEVYLARRKTRLQVGDVIVARHPQRNELLTVKRIVRREPSGWWVEGDSVHGSNDSRDFGVVPDQLVQAKIVCRIRPLARRINRRHRDEPAR
jgi:nickel-type superoxide dismutase maturation protease